MNDRVQRVLRGIPLERDRVAHAGGETPAVRRGLVELVAVEHPDTAVFIEDRAGIAAQRAFLAVLFLAGIRRRADVHVQRAVRIERERLVRVLAFLGKAGHHRLARAGRREFTLFQRVTVHTDVVRDVQPVLVDHDAGALHVAELRRLVDLAVAVLVAHRDQPIAAGEVDVAIGRDREMPSGAETLLHDRDGESGRNRETDLAGGQGDSAQHRDRQTNYSS